MEAVGHTKYVKLARGECLIRDRGVVGWYRVFEMSGVLLDKCRIGWTIGWDETSLRYRIVRVAPLLRPESGGVVVFAEAVGESKKRMKRERKSDAE